MSVALDRVAPSGRDRRNFASLPEVLPLPNLIETQLVRSPGVYFTAVDDPTTGRRLFYAKLIPNRGAWLEFETSNKDVISVKVDRKRKLTVTTLLRAIGYNSNEEISALFTDVDSDPEHQYIESTLERDPTTNTNEGLVEDYK